MWQVCLGIDDLLERYPVGLHDPERSAELMKSSGWTRNAESLWEKDGDTIRIVIEGYPGLFLDITPIMEHPGVTRYKERHGELPSG